MIAFIKKLIERLKMLLDRFIMSSDHDGQKEANSLDLQFTVTSFGLPAQNPFRYYDFEAPKGSFFANVVFSDSLLPNKIFPTPSVRFISGDIQIGLFAFRVDESHYRVWVVHQLKQGVASGTVPDHTVRVRLKFYVASKSS